MTATFDVTGRLFMSDTLRDVNGDGYRDRVITSYSNTGCCRRTHDHVFLYDATTKGFAPELGFLNVVYVPSEGLVRGMEYGHPGHAPFYTSRFVGLDVETVECVFRTPDAPMPYEVGSCGDDRARQPVSQLPPGYEVMGPYIDWFEGNVP